MPDGSAPNTLYPDIPKEGQSQCPQHSVPGYSQGRSVTPTLCTRIFPRKVSHMPREVSHSNTLYPDIAEEGQSQSPQHSVPGCCQGRSVTPTLCTRILPRKVSHMPRKVSHPSTLYQDTAKEGLSQCPQNSVPGCCQGRSVTPTLDLYSDTAEEGQSPQHSVPGYSQGRSVTTTLYTLILLSKSVTAPQHSVYTRIYPRKVSHPNTLYPDIAEEGQSQSPQYSVPGYCQGRSVSPTLCTWILPRKVGHSNTLYPGIA